MAVVEIIESLVEGDGAEELLRTIDSVSDIPSSEEEGATEDFEVDGVTEGVSTEGDGFSREDGFIEVDCFPEKDESSKEVAFCCVSLPLDCGLRI